MGIFSEKVLELIDTLEIYMAILQEDLDKLEEDDGDAAWEIQGNLADLDDAIISLKKDEVNREEYLYAKGLYYDILYR